MINNNNTLWIWLLIVLIGLSILSSFCTVGFGGFDIWFFLIAFGYIIISNTSFLFIERAVINNSGRVSRARRLVYKEYEFIDKNDLWDSLIVYDLALAYSSFYYRAVFAYYGWCEWRSENKIKQHSEIEIRELIIKGNLSETLEKENYPYKYRKIIKKMESKVNKTNYYWDKQYNKFKNGSLLNQSSNSSIYSWVCLLLSIASIVTSIMVTINVFPETSLFIKLLFMSVVIVADIVSDVITIRHSIGFEEKHCNAIIKCINFLLKKGNGGTFDQAFLNQLCNCGKDTKERHDNYTIDDAVTIIKTIDSHFFDRLNAPK